MRFFIKDINQQLINCSTISKIVYRGLLMRKDQIEFIKKLKKEEILRFNSFIIANENKEQTVKSLRNSSNTNDLEKVLFEIDSNQIAKQYQQFIIFPITTCFSILSINYEQDISIIKIKVSNLYKSIEKKCKSSFDLANYLRQIGKLDQSEKLFYILLNQYPSLSSSCYDGLGRIAQDKGLYELSLEFYLKSFQTVSLENRANSLNNIGCAYDYLEKYEEALQYYSEALTLMKTDLEQATCLNNIGITYGKNEQYQQAIQCFERSLSIRKKNLSDNHINIGISYTNLGVIWSSIGELDCAIELFNLALKSFSLSKYYIYQAIVYQNMAKIYQEKSQFHQALTFYQNAEYIFRQYRPIDHPNLLYIQQQIQQLTQKN